jgi:hypothetical protein
MPLSTLSIKSLEELVLSKCDSFVRMGVWPSGEKLKPRKWLDNFEASEREFALYLLNSFTYYNMDMCIALLRASFLNLSILLQKNDTISQHLSSWDKLLADSIFIPVTGESRNITDSGNILAGHVRREMRIPQDNILTVDLLYDTGYMQSLRNFKHIIFFDDFVGSGRQFLTMWNDYFEKDAKIFDSVHDQCKKLNLTSHYCAMVGTRYGVNRIINGATDIDLHFAHILEQNMSPMHADSIIWPEHLKKDALGFIEKASKRAGIPDNQIAGFHDLGLTIAFEFTVPDATLPVFRWRKNGWSALMEKS